MNFYSCAASGRRGKGGVCVLCVCVCVCVQCTHEMCTLVFLTFLHSCSKPPRTDIALNVGQPLQSIQCSGAIIKKRNPISKIHVPLAVCFNLSGPPDGRRRNRPLPSRDKNVIQQDCFPFNVEGLFCFLLRRAAPRLEPRQIEKGNFYAIARNRLTRYLMRS